MIKAEDEDRLLGRKGAEVHAVQDADKRIILGSEYVALKCTLCDARNHVGVRGERILIYTNERFEKDFNERRGDFKISFDATSICQTLDWCTIMENTSSLKCF